MLSLSQEQVENIAKLKDEVDIFINDLKDRLYSIINLIYKSCR
jgi:hypothetical protein